MTNTLNRIQSYRNNPAISQSEIKALLSGKYLVRKPSLTMLIGSYLDCVITCPEIKDELFYTCDVSRPTDKIVELCDSFYEWVKIELDPYNYESVVVDNVLSDYKIYIEEWIEMVDYYSNRPKTRVEKFIKEAEDWWTVLVQKGDRQIITSVEELETELIKIRLENDSSLDWIWNAEFQKDFYWTEERIDCKGLGDICLSEVYIDLKYTTCSNLREWWKVCANLNYPFQMAFYQSGLGVKKCYWLVVHKDWHELVEVSELMYQIGKWGYNSSREIQIGKVTKQITTHVNGYLDGLNLLNGNVSKEINDELFLINC